jgi:fused signal recognition particle receptor
MFDRLKSVVAQLRELATKKTLSEREVDQFLWELELRLLEGDVAQEVAEDLVAHLRREVVGRTVERSADTARLLEEALKARMLELFREAGQLDPLQLAREEKGPFIIVFLGVNGSGKTTTLAKLGRLFLKEGLSVVFACADTFRAGAIEQLQEHAARLGVKVVAQRYGADPAAVARDAVLYAQAHNVRVVLVDTAGRMQTSRNLMDEMRKIIRVVSPQLKLFVGDALAGNDAVNQAREFFAYTEFDGAILTKVDADVKGGSALSIAYATKRPIVYLGVGQHYDDLVPFDPERFVESLFAPNR